MSDIETLLQSVRREVILNANTFEDAVSEEVVSRRDQPEFEGEWLRIFDELKDVSLSTEQSTVAEHIREAAYKAVFKHTGNPDLSGYVSDDFEIIAKGVCSGTDRVFLNGLLEAYTENTIPGPTIPWSRKSLTSLVDQLRERLTTSRQS